MLTSKSFGYSITDEAFSAVWSADNDRALALLHNVDAPGCTAMRARVWFRVRRLERTIAEFDRREPGRYMAPEATALACTAAFAHAMLGNELQAQRALVAAKAAARRSNDPLLRLHCGYAGARVDYLLGNLARSRRALDDVSAEASGHSGAEVRTPYQLELNHLRARIFELEGRHRAFAGDYAGQEERLVSALLATELVRRRDRWFEAQLLASLSELLAAFPSQRSRQFVLSRSMRLSWTSHLDHAAQFVKRGLRNNRRLFGFDEPIDAIGGRSAPSLASRLGERVDALLVDEWNGGKPFLEELRFAVSIALDVDWAATAEHEATHLAWLAVLLTAVEPALSQRMCGRYLNRIAQVPATSTILREPRRQALEIFRDGCAAKACGDWQIAHERLGRALEFWRSRGFGWKASIAGVERFSVSREPSDLEPAAAFLAAFPDTSFSRRLARALELAPRSEPGAFAYLGLYASPEPVAASIVSTTGASHPGPSRGCAAPALTPPGRADRTA
jgi:hypothetical protein